jgi:hypothetical protein
MSYILPLTANEVERRLKRVADLYIHPATYKEPEVENGEARIKVSLNYSIEDGSELKFRAPEQLKSTTRLCVQYKDRNGDGAEQPFAFADANGNDVGEVSNLFAKDAVVKVILDGVNRSGKIGKALVQNADTNKYLEDRFDEVANTYISKVQDTANAGKVLKIDENGEVIPDDVNAFYTDEEEIDAVVAPLHADTLGGLPANEYATKNNIKTLLKELSASDVGALPISGGTMTGPIKFNGIFLKEGIDYGTELPDVDEAEEGQIFFLEVDE